MNKLKGLLIFVLLVKSAAIEAKEASWLYVDPPTQEYHIGRLGEGKLKICKAEDEPDTKNMVVPKGTYFNDMGSISGFDLSKPRAWLLTVVTANAVSFKVGQKCAIVAARVVNSYPPSGHPELKEVVRFSMVDNRYFEIGAPSDINAPVPDLAPWNPGYPMLHATAISDFK